MNITSEVRQRINDIAERNGGHITPEEVLQDAQDPSSPLHAAGFDWNVDTAARANWLDTARRLIRGVRVVFKEERTVIRTVAYIRDPSLPPDRSGYVSIAKLRTDADLSYDAAFNECVRAAANIRRARDVGAALGVGEQIDAILQQIDELTQLVRKGRHIVARHGQTVQGLAAAMQ